MKRTKIAEIRSSEKIGDQYVVMGWVRTKRDSKGGFSFIELNDGSCLSGLQVIADEKLLPAANDYTIQYSSVYLNLGHNSNTLRIHEKY